ncbi:MAG: hypothetical protein QXU44_04675 [Candidatus Caldarchaeum sp.]
MKMVTNKPFGIWSVCDHCGIKIEFGKKYVVCRELDRKSEIVDRIKRWISRKMESSFGKTPLDVVTDSERVFISSDYMDVSEKDINITITALTNIMCVV